MFICSDVQQKKELPNEIRDAPFLSLEMLKQKLGINLSGIPVDSSAKCDVRTT